MDVTIDSEPSNKNGDIRTKCKMFGFYNLSNKNEFGNLGKLEFLPAQLC